MPTSVWMASIPFDDTAQEGGAGAGNAYFAVSRDGSRSQPLWVYLDQGGQVPTSQYTLTVDGYGAIEAGMPFPMAAGASTVTVMLTALDDSVPEATQNVTITVLDPGNGSYTVGSPSIVLLHILDNDTPPPIVISQIYGAGGEPGATYNRDFIELFNPSDQTADLSGWSVQIPDPDPEIAAWQVIPLSGTLAPGQYRLIAGSSGANGLALPTPDQTTSADLDAATGKVALLNTTSPLLGAVPVSPAGLIDLVGYGEADWYEGQGPAPATDPANAALRLGQGNYDTGENGWDFTADVPTPRNSAAPIANRMPVVTAPGTRVTALNTPFTFSAAGGTALLVADPDAGSSPVELTLNAGNGALTLGGVSGLTFSEGDGTADPSMRFTGTLSAINTALNGTTFTPTTGFQGAGFVTAWIDDLGNTGAGSALVGYNSTMVVVGGPVVALNDTVDGREGTQSRIDVWANDVWAGDTWPTTTIVSGPAHGTATIDNHGTPSDPGDDEVVYTPAGNYHGADSFNYRLDDGLGHTSTATVSVTVADVNDARIETTGDSNMYADEGELVNIGFFTPDATVPITWAASGLPIGLSINSSTGVISGRPQYSEAGAHAVTLTATASNGDTDHVDLTWNVADVNRLPWIDDQAHQEGQSANVYFYAGDNINPPSTWSYTFSGLPAGMTYPNNPIPIGAAGDYNVTISMTAGGATDTRTYHWLIVPAAHAIPPGQTPAPGLAAFAIENTLVHHDDVGLVDQHQHMTVKLFLTELDYANIANNSLQVKLQIMSGGAGLTTDPNDPVGSSSVIVSPTENSGAVATVYADLIPHAPSVGTDDIVIKAFRRINNVWVMMGGGGGDNAVKDVQIGTGRDPFTGLPNFARVGKIDAETTPAEMSAPGKYRIPPRNWDATDLWVMKTGDIGVGKSLYLVAPRDWSNAQNGNGQNNINGRVALYNTANSWKGEWWVKLEDENFAAGVAKVWIWGHLDANKVYQTNPDRAGRLTLGVYSVGDDSSPPKSLGREFATTQGFSVAAIPVKMQIKKAEVITTTTDLGGGEKRYAVGEVTAGVHNGTPVYVYIAGVRYGIRAISDSGEPYLSDLSEIGIAESVKPVKQTGWFKDAGSESTTDYLAATKATGKVDPGNLTDKLTIVAGADRETIDKSAGENRARRLREMANVLLRQVDRDKVNPENGGELEVKQLFLFKDARTGATRVPVTNSGFLHKDSIVIVKAKTEITLKIQDLPQDVTLSPTLSAKKGGADAGLDKVFSLTIPGDYKPD